MLTQEIFLCPRLSPALFPVPLGTRTTSNSLPGIFSLPGVLCLILGALLFMVLVILVTQLLRWRAERRGGLQGELGTGRVCGGRRWGRCEEGTWARYCCELQTPCAPC